MGKLRKTAVLTRRLPFYAKKTRFRTQFSLRPTLPGPWRAFWQKVQHCTSDSSPLTASRKKVKSGEIEENGRPDPSTSTFTPTRRNSARNLALGPPCQVPGGRSGIRCSTAQAIPHLLPRRGKKSKSGEIEENGRPDPSTSTFTPRRRDSARNLALGPPCQVPGRRSGTRCSTAQAFLHLLPGL